MKKNFLFMALLVLSCNFAFAQNSTSDDPQISDRNYKHANKAAKAERTNKDQHYNAGSTVTTENTNYKSSFKNNETTTNKSTIATGTTTRSYSGRTTTRNYKKQF